MSVRIAPATGSLRRLDPCEREKRVRAKLLAAVPHVSWEVADGEGKLIVRGAAFRKGEQPWNG